ncbi:MAG: hypothetical protein ACFFKA_18645, partial [Candidatus Thorarchaeota archaeon]
MKKIKPKKKSKIAEFIAENQAENVKNPKIEILSKITEIKNIANSSLLKNNYDDAIKYSEKIIRFAIKYNMD